MSTPISRAAKSLSKALLFLVPLTLPACGDKSAPADPDAGAPVAPLREADLAPVCTGKGEPRAKPFAKDGAALHPLVMFARWDSFATPEIQSAPILGLGGFATSKAADVELVACVTRTAEAQVRTCNYQVPGRNDRRDLLVFSASYEISIREASTAAVLATRNVSFPSPACPSGHTFKDALDNKLYPDASYAVVDLAKGFVVPPGGVASVRPKNGAPYLQHFELAKVCYGLPQPDATPYEKVSGKISPTLVMSRTGENEGYWERGYPEWKPWLVENASSYQLLACVSEKSRETKRQCKIKDDGAMKTLDLVAATYEIVLREMRTGKVLSTVTATAEPDKTCPKEAYFPGGASSTEDVAWPRKEIEDLVRPFAEPK